MSSFEGFAIKVRSGKYETKRKYIFAVMSQIKMNKDFLEFVLKYQGVLDMCYH